MSVQDADETSTEDCSGSAVPYHVEEYRGFTINVYHDDDPVDPRNDCECFGTLALYHRRMNLGDEKEFENGVDLKEWLEENEDNVVYCNVYAYEHGGIMLSVSNEGYPFNDRWDAGQLGVIYAKRDKVEAEFGGWTPETIERARKLLVYEVEEYSHFIADDNVRFAVLAPSNEVVTELNAPHHAEALRYAKETIDGRLEDSIDKTETEG